MLETLISSKTRVKLLLKFFLNSSTTDYLRNLEAEFGESTNAIRLELNRLEEAGMLSSFLDGNKKKFQANKNHPLFKDIHNIIKKYVGLDQIIENVIERLGEVEEVFLTGGFAKGLDSNVIDLIFVGNIDRVYLNELVGKVENLICRKVRFVIFSESEFQENYKEKEKNSFLLLWSK
ncbi:MAG: ArsR family transcriptional regulator [Saprospiraceae bacterium]|jgi:hypothetical protein